MDEVKSRKQHRWPDHPPTEAQREACIKACIIPDYFYTTWAVYRADDTWAIKKVGAFASRVAAVAFVEANGWDLVV